MAPGVKKVFRRKAYISETIASVEICMLYFSRLGLKKDIISELLIVLNYERKFYFLFASEKVLSVVVVVKVKVKLGGCAIPSQGCGARLPLRSYNESTPEQEGDMKSGFPPYIHRVSQFTNLSTNPKREDEVLGGLCT